LLAGAGAALIVGALQGCGVGVRETAPTSSPGKLVFPRLRASVDRITRITVCTRPFRAQGPRLDAEQIGRKTIVHNYGHGGSGWSLSWGSGAIAVQKAMATGERDIAVIGCGALGLTSAILLQRAGAQVTIYAKELPPNVRSSLATGLWTPDSRICFEQHATPAFKQTWQTMARNSFQTYQTLLGLPGNPVEFIDSYVVSDNADTERHHGAATDQRPKFAELQRELVSELIPKSEEYGPGRHPFDQRYLRRNTLMMFNLAAYSRLLMSDFAANGGKIEIVGDNSVGLFADNGKIFGTNLTVATLGRGAAGAEADNGGSIRLNGSSITTAGINAYGASVSGAGSSITFTNSDVLSSQGSGASVDNGARLTLAGSNLTALVHGIVATRGTAAAPNSIVINAGNLITVFGDAFQVQNGAANITVSNSATVTGNSALLRVLDPASATIVNFNASHASLFGDIFADPASQTTVNLTDSTVLTGKVNPPPLGLGVDMRIDGSSQWVLTGSSNVKSLSVSPGADIVFRAPFDLRKMLTLGRLSGTGGTFGMNIDLRHEVGDLIDITGPSAGSHLLTFFDRGAGTDLRANAALLVVKTSDGIAGFSGMIDRAVFKYYVVHGNGSSATPIPDDWYLVRADRILRDQVIRPSNLPAGSINTPLGLSPVDALSNAANAAIGTYAAGVPLFYADMDTLIQRLGDLRFLRGDDRASVDSNGKAIIPSAPPEEPTIGTWVRGFGNGMHVNDQVSRAFDQNTGGFQLGADKRFSALQGDLYLGGFLSYFNASRDFLDGGDGSTNAFSVGTYATWINPNGWYADLALKYTQLWNYFHTPLSDGSFSTGDYSIPSLGGSLEVGKRFDVGKFFIEPQAQLSTADSYNDLIVGMRESAPVYLRDVDGHGVGAG